MKHLEVVCAIIENDEGKIFCCLRNKGKALEGYWEFPGGKVEKNETHQDTIIRELKEELDVLVDVISFVGESSYVYDDLYPYENFSITLYAYKCKIIDGDIKLLEHKDSVWASVEEMKNMKFAPADIELIERIDKFI